MSSIKTHDMNKKILKLAHDNINQNSFVSTYDATDVETLGIAMSKYFEFDGEKIIECFISALEDCNYHREVEIVKAMQRSDQR